MSLSQSLSLSNISKFVLNTFILLSSKVLNQLTANLETQTEISEDLEKSVLYWHWQY